MASNLYRADGWVKTAQGPALAGAQIYVCTQPANVASAPPSPLANCFSDPGGLVPISFPLFTDGFGHYDFYTLPGLYTLVVAYNGIIQQIYPDQSVGNVGTGGGGTTITLEVNGASTSNPSLLNLVAGPGISLTDEGGGAIQISSSGSGITLKTNGVTNTDQALLNLVAGTNVTLSSDAFGDVTINAPGGGTSAGSNVFLTPNFTAGAGNLAGETIVLWIPACRVAATGGHIKVGIMWYNVSNGAGPIINAARIGATVPNAPPGQSGYTYNYAWTTSPVPITWSTTFSNNGVIYLSNSSAITVDTLHDYYVTVYIDPTNGAYTPYYATSSDTYNTGLGGYRGGNHTNDADASGLTSSSLVSSGILGIQQVVTA
jgi:hypothetical protein